MGAVFLAELLDRSGAQQPGTVPGPPTAACLFTCSVYMLAWPCGHFETLEAYVILRNISPAGKMAQEQFGELGVQQ